MDGRRPPKIHAAPGLDRKVAVEELAVSPLAGAAPIPAEEELDERAPQAVGLRDGAEPRPEQDIAVHAVLRIGDREVRVPTGRFVAPRPEPHFESRIDPLIAHPGFRQAQVDVDRSVTGVRLDHAAETSRELGWYEGDDGLPLGERGRRRQQEQQYEEDRPHFSAIRVSARTLHSQRVSGFVPHRTRLQQNPGHQPEDVFRAFRELPCRGLVATGFPAVPTRGFLHSLENARARAVERRLRLQCLVSPHAITAECPHCRFPRLPRCGHALDRKICGAGRSPATSTPSSSAASVALSPRPTLACGPSTCAPARGGRHRDRRGALAAGGSVQRASGRTDRAPCDVHRPAAEAHRVYGAVAQGPDADAKCGFRSLPSAALPRSAC